MLIDQGLIWSMELSVGNFIYFHYYVTNVSKPTKEEIIEYLKELKKTEI